MSAHHEIAEVILDRLCVMIRRDTPASIDEALAVSEYYGLMAGPDVPTKRQLRAIVADKLAKDEVELARRFPCVRSRRFW